MKHTGPVLYFLVICFFIFFGINGIAQQAVIRAGTNLAELKTWKRAGIQPAEILKCMTVNAAELMGMEADRGEIKAGLKADIIASRNNPLENIENLNSIHFVMKDGKIIRYDNQ
jgi:imidazolonepropionase-like amidohydrolase